MITVSKEQLKKFVTRIFVHAGLSEPDADQAAQLIVQAELSGVTTHGLARVPVYYAGKLIEGRAAKHPRLRQTNESDHIIALDADDGLGIVTAPKALDLCIEKAKKYGIAAVSVKRSNHYGVGNYYALKGIENDMIVLVTTNTTAFVAPTGGKERLIGTNPITVGIPAGKQLPVILDMATSATSFGKLEEMARENQKIPFGWALDKDGNPTDDPNAGMAGALLSFGGYKGYGLSVIVELLAPVLAGACFGNDVGRPEIPNNPQPEGVGHFMMAIDISQVRPLGEFKETVDRYISIIKNSKLAEGAKEIYMPGELELRRMKEREENGIPLSDAVTESILNFAKQIKMAKESDTFESILM